MTTLHINRTLIGALSERPDPSREVILWIDQDTGMQSVADGTQWVDVGGGGGASYPGVAGDGLTPAGLLIDGALVTGDPNATTSPSASTHYGTVTFQDTLANYAGGVGVIEILQTRAVPSGGYAAQAVTILRLGSIAAADYDTPMVELQDSTGSAQPIVRLVKDGVPVLMIGDQQSITGALSSVTDANAKAVLTSIIAALTGIAVAADGTT